MDLAHDNGGLWKSLCGMALDNVDLAHRRQDFKSLCGRALENMDVAHHRGGLWKSFIVVPVFLSLPLCQKRLIKSSARSLPSDLPL